MHRVIYIFGLLFSFLFVVVLSQQNLYAETLTQPLLATVDLQTWYQAETGYLPNPETFGIFDVQPVGDMLYFGVGTGAPAELDGALLASTDGISLTNLGVLDEQGVDELAWFADALHIAGVDPCCGDDWTLGNHYIFEQDSGLTKYRGEQTGLQNVLHVWDFEIVDDYLYAAASGRHGEDLRDTGMIYRTQDGISWELMSYLGDWRANGLLAHEAHFYALFVDEFMSSEINLAVSSDAVTWTPILTQTLQPIALREFNGQILTVSHDRETIFAISADHTIQSFTPPAPLGVSWPYAINRNIWTVIPPYLYAIVERENGGSSIVRSTDLIDWELVLDSADSLLTLTHWQSKNEIIITSRESGLALLPLQNETLPITLQAQITSTTSSVLLCFLIGFLTLGTAVILKYNALVGNVVKS